MIQVEVKWNFKFIPLLCKKYQTGYNYNVKNNYKRGTE